MNNIKKARLSKGISQTKLANILNISKQSVSAYENDSREPKLSTWKKMSTALDVSIGYLQGVSDIKDPEILESFDKFINTQKYDPKSDSFLINRKESLNVLNEISTNTFLKTAQAILSPETTDQKYVDIANNLSNRVSINEINTILKDVFCLLLDSASGDKKAKKYEDKIVELTERYDGSYEFIKQDMEIDKEIEKNKKNNSDI
ncbi:helix-turn-helix domain-containing protein [Companilactobacillus nantensis]|uniref:HTH cro/C1-type domain-containing protein n=1 Tax=Companilactobacillus nantensis DSM 16982 TaxID=1423774 RepID=A0A0R1WBM8_9LACO|nr:helix-turn-helix domain-containing protein [Companilactobacillus nantensis]KRM15386.1 hypothetical protein FD31_GL001239 [Companilactobacillus nantensis DSM 16982]GEO65048.1 hypothetical protein LNA01_22310 [Companilactobacillus nantensis]